MSIRRLSAAKALIVLCASGLLLSGCYYQRSYYGGPHYAPPSYGYKHDHYHGKAKKHGYGHYHHGKGKKRGYGYYGRGYRGYY